MFKPGGLFSGWLSSKMHLLWVYVRIIPLTVLWRYYRRMPRNSKSRPELPLLPPIDFHPPSNGEFWPLPPSLRALEAMRRWLLMVEEKHRRLGMTRRDFANSACGYAAALLAINQASCASSKPNASKDAGVGSDSPSAGNGPIPGCGMPTSTSGTTPGMNSVPGVGALPTASGSPTIPGGGMSTGGGPVNADAGWPSPPSIPATGDAGFMVTEEMTEDVDAAAEMLGGNEFIFDVQTHTSTEIAEPWDGIPPDERALDFITQIFVQSETDVAVLSGPPNSRSLGAPSMAARAQVQELIDRLAGPRLLIHANADPERGAAELDYMGQLAEQYNPSAWKVYPHEGSLLLNSDELGIPFVEAARTLGVRMVAAHRGLWDNGGYESNASPADIVRTAAAAPDLDFLVYHSGYERMTNEDHAYDPTSGDHFGVDRMVRALNETGIGADGNVYAELGSTWANVMTEPEQAAHVLGKLLNALGPDRILWGTDCVYNGIPQSQIVAFRMFQIPVQMQEQFGYPALTPDIKAKIFGLNAARLYGVDVGATRSEISADDVSALRLALLNDPASVPVPDRRRYEGPRTRRQFLQLLEHQKFFGHG